MVLQADQSTTQGSAHAPRGAPETTKPPLRSAEAAVYIGMSDSWLRQTRMAGRTDGPAFVRAGARSVRYRLADLDRWLERRLCAGGRTQPEPEPTQPHPKPKPKRGRRPPVRRSRQRPIR